jgi:hypothetical protein
VDPEYTSVLELGVGKEKTAIIVCQVMSWATHTNSLKHTAEHVPNLVTSVEGRVRVSDLVFGHFLSESEET